jgi:3-phenylpropionate/trans-cinnamate dioxygenase ferredoxin subunit
MHKACPLSELAAGEALRLDTSPPIAVFHTGEGSTCATEAWTRRRPKLPVRSHEVTVIDGDITIIESTEAPNLPAGLAVDGHV